MWVLGIELRNSGRAISAFNTQTSLQSLKAFLMSVSLLCMQVRARFQILNPYSTILPTHFCRQGVIMTC